MNEIVSYGFMCEYCKKWIVVKNFFDHICNINMIKIQGQSQNSTDSDNRFHINTEKDKK